MWYLYGQGFLESHVLEADGFSSDLTMQLELEDKTVSFQEGFLVALGQTGPV